MMCEPMGVYLTAFSTQMVYCTFAQTTWNVYTVKVFLKDYTVIGLCLMFNLVLDAIAIKNIWTYGLPST